MKELIYKLLKHEAGVGYTADQLLRCVLYEALDELVNEGQIKCRWEKDDVRYYVVESDTL